MTSSLPALSTIVQESNPQTTLQSATTTTTTTIYNIRTMKASVIISLFSLGALSSVMSFAPSAAFTTKKISLTTFFAEPEAEEEGGFDLDLEEMFDM